MSKLWVETYTCNRDTFMKLCAEMLFRFQWHLNIISVIKFQKSTFADQPINPAVVYRSPSSSRVKFVNYLVDIVQEYNMNVSLGDFNINAFHDTYRII